MQTRKYFCGIALMSFSTRDHIQQHSEGLRSYKASSLIASCSCQLLRPCSSPPWDSQQLTRFSLHQLTVLLLGGTSQEEWSLQTSQSTQLPKDATGPHSHAQAQCMTRGAPGIRATTWCWGQWARLARRALWAASGGHGASQHLYLLRCTYYKPCSQKAAMELYWAACKQHCSGM